MRFKGWICSLILLVSGLSAAHAQANEGCIPQTEIDEIASSFSQFRHLGGREYCYDGSQESQLIAGIMFMRKTAFAPSMPKSADELFSGKFATSWWDYFIGRINEFNVEASCPKGVAAFVYFWGNTMYVCPLALTANYTSLDLASVFMHEARHIDGFPHTTCRSGPRAGLQGACDTRISEGGSYAVTVETYAQIAKYATDLHPAMRAYAKSSSVIYADEAFDTPARVDRQENFVVMTQDKKFHELSIVNGVAETKELGASPALGHVVKRAQHFVIYPEDKSLTSGYIFTGNQGVLNQQAGDISAEYNAATPATRADWKDVYLGGRWFAIAKRNEVIFGCDIRSDDRRALSLNGETAVSILYPTGYDRSARSLSLVTESGKVFEFGCNGTSPSLQDTGRKYDRALKRLYKSGSEVLALGMDGNLYRVNGMTTTPLANGLDGQIFDLVAGQSFSFFE